MAGISTGPEAARASALKRRENGSCALRVTAEDISLDAGRERGAGRDLLDHTSDACRFAFKMRLFALHDETFSLGVSRECRK